MALALEEKFDEVRQLIVIGKEKGYLLYDEVNDLLPADLTANPEDLVTRWRSIEDGSPGY